MSRTIVAVALIAGVALCAGAPAAWGRTAPLAPTAVPPAHPRSAANGTAGTSGEQAAGSANLLGSLGGSDPFCGGVPGGGGLTPEQQANCRVSGSVAEPYPISSYGLDVQSPSITGAVSAVGTGGLVDPGSIGDWIGYAFQSMGALVWEILVYAIRAVLLLLQWAFSLDLVSKAMSSVTQALNVLHNDVFGDAWLDAALAVLALWGIWNGLVRRRTIETFAGLLATMLMIVAALVLIAQPQATVGTLSNYANQASLTTLSALSRASVAQPANALASAEGDLFTSLVLDPWCALEFGSVSYCTSPRDGTTVADVWLGSSANSTARQQLYQLATTGSPNGSVGHQITSTLLDLGETVAGNPDGAVQATTEFLPPSVCPHGASKCPAATVANADIKNHAQDVQMQGAGGNTVDRLTLLAIILAGLSGAIALLLYIGLKLLFAAIKVLLLILGAPVMLFVAAFGESGRATFTAWAKALIGAIVTKLVYTVLLALVLLTAMIIDSLLRGVGWFSVWVFSAIFWWGVFFERRLLTQYLEMDRRVADRGLDISGRGAPFRVTGALIGGFAAWRALRGLTRGVAALPRTVHQRGLERRTAASAAYRNEFNAEMTGRAGRAIGLQERGNAAAARAEIAAHDTRQTNLQGMRDDRVVTRRAVATYEGLLRRKGLSLAARTRYDAMRAAATVRLDTLDMAIPQEESILRGAQGTVNRHRAMLETMSQQKRAEDPAELAREVRQRQDDVAPGMTFPNPSAPSDRHRLDRSLRWAGIDPDAYHAPTATPGVRDSFLRSARESWERDRALSVRLNDPRARTGLPNSPFENAQARQELVARGPQYAERAAVRTAEERRALHTARRVRSRPRGRQGL